MFDYWLLWDNDSAETQPHSTDAEGNRNLGPEESGPRLCILPTHPAAVDVGGVSTFIVKRRGRLRFTIKLSAGAKCRRMHWKREPRGEARTLVSEIRSHRENPGSGGRRHRRQGVNQPEGSIVRNQARPRKQIIKDKKNRWVQACFGFRFSRQAHAL